MVNQLVEAMKIGEEKARQEMEVASHDNPIFKSVPATGPRGDQPAGQQWKDLLKDESLLKTIERLKISMADPLPHPAEDTPQRPDPTKPGQSPWLPGKSPAPSRDDKLAHGTHQEPDGWSMPSGTHDPAEHKQYDPGGGPLFNPLDGGDVVPWDERPKEIASVDYSGIPNNRDLMIKKIINTYGKDDKGNYKDPTLLIRGLLDAARV